MTSGSTCACVALQQLCAHPSQAEPVPRVEGQQVAQLLQTPHPGSDVAEMLVDAGLHISIQIRMIRKRLNVPERMCSGGCRP